MNNIVSFTRAGIIPPVAWAVAQLIVINGLDPDTVASAVNAYVAACSDADENDDGEPAAH